MKGIVHFISGIAVATFVPGAVAQAVAGSPLLVLGGLFGLLPDTLDFKFLRYLEPVDRAIDPDPQNFQPQAIAEQVATAMREAYDSGEPRRLVLHTVRLGADRWQAYHVRFLPASGEVAVRVGTVVDTSQRPLPGTAPADQEDIASTGRAAASVPLVQTYDQEIAIDIFSGPCFQFERRGDAVHVTFLPWHRRWSHSLTVAAVVGLGIGWLLGPTAGWISGLGFATHVLQDQLGHMGSNLFWPVTQQRVPGIGLLHSGDALPNFATVWIALSLILLNLDRFSWIPQLPAATWIVLTVLLPGLLSWTLYQRRRRAAPPTPEEARRQAEILTEAEEIEL